MPTPPPPDNPATSPPASDPLAFPSRAAIAADLPAVEALHDVVFGPGALTRASYRVRERQPVLSPFCRVLFHDGQLIAAIRYTAIRVGGESNALMLGPLVVVPAFAGRGHARRLIAESLETARAAGIALIVLVGDPLYYARHGFVRSPPGRISMPSPVDAGRLLVLELSAGAAAGYEGRVEGVA